MDQARDGTKSKPPNDRDRKREDKREDKREEKKGGLKNRGGEKTKRPDRSRTVRVGVDPHDRTISAGL